jgi:hypothetical protein
MNKVYILEVYDPGVDAALSSILGVFSTQKAAEEHRDYYESNSPSDRAEFFINEYNVTE